MKIWATSISWLLLTVTAVCGVIISSGIKKMWFHVIKMKDCREKSLSFPPSWEPQTPFSFSGTLDDLSAYLRIWLSHYLSCLIVNGLCHVSLLKLASENSFLFQISLQYLSQPISWVLVSWTAPKPSEYSLLCSRGFSVAVMRCVHKVAALHIPHSL